MRIVGGTLSGRRFRGPKSDGTRPTSERVREAIFSALEARDLVADTLVLDLFAGTGAMAFEALSRGARRAVLVEKGRGVAKAIEKSAKVLGLADRVQVRVADLERADARPWLEALGEPVGLVLIDPPYAKIDRVAALLEILAEGGHLAPEATVVIEHAKKAPPTLPIGFAEISRYRYGDTAVLLALLDSSGDTHR